MNDGFHKYFFRINHKGHEGFTKLDLINNVTVAQPTTPRYKRGANGVNMPYISAKYKNSSPKCLDFREEFFIKLSTGKLLFCRWLKTSQGFTFGVS
jgi:hypothetical protein